MNCVLRFLLNVTNALTTDQHRLFCYIEYLAAFGIVSGLPCASCQLYVVSCPGGKLMAAAAVAAAAAAAAAALELISA